MPSSLKRARPHSSVMRCSPDAETLIGAGSSSLAISVSFFAGTVTAPASSTSAVTSVLTAISRSVPDRRIPRSVVSSRIFASTGSVVLDGMLAATAASPSCNFSREIVKRIPYSTELRVACGTDVPLGAARCRLPGPVPVHTAGTALLLLCCKEKRIVVVVEAVDVCRVAVSYGFHATLHRPGNVDRCGKAPCCTQACGQRTSALHTRPAVSTNGRLRAQLFQPRAQVSHTLGEHRVGGDLGGDAVEAVDDGRVIAAAERVADLHQLNAEQLAAEEHRDLSRRRECLGAGLGLEPVRGDAPLARDRILDRLDGDAAGAPASPVVPAVVGAAAELVVERLRRHVDRDRPVPERGVGEQLDDRALEFPDARPHVLGDEADHVFRDRMLEVVELRLVLEDRDAVLEVRRLDVGHHAPLEAAHEPRLEARDLGRRPVAREDDLATCLVECVERVEELVLCGFLPLEELYVVDQEQIRLAITAAEVVGRARLNRRHQLVRDRKSTRLN